MEQQTNLSEEKNKKLSDILMNIKTFPFRPLKANEIEVRVGQVFYTDETKKEIKGISCLLYKNARVDMVLLNEIYGSLFWQRKHEFKDGKLYCSVGVYNNEIKEWIWKEDVGVESNTEAEKGQASDSFKRACFNFGLGIELYSAPFIWITPLEKEKIKNTRFIVRHIGYDENRKITELIIEDDKGNVRFEKYDREKKEEKAVKKTTTKKVEEKKEDPKEEKNTTQKVADNFTRDKAIMELGLYGGTIEKVAAYYKTSVENVTTEQIMSLVTAKKKKLGIIE